MKRIAAVMIAVMTLLVSALTVSCQRDPDRVVSILLTYHTDKEEMMKEEEPSLIMFTKEGVDKEYQKQKHLDSWSWTVTDIAEPYYLNLFFVTASGKYINNYQYDKGFKQLCPFFFMKIEYWEDNKTLEEVETIYKPGKYGITLSRFSGSMFDADIGMEFLYYIDFYLYVNE